MKTTTFLASVFLSVILITGHTSLAQTPQKVQPNKTSSVGKTLERNIQISKFDLGRVVTKDDIQLVNLVKGELDLNKWEKNEVQLGKLNLSVGKTMTKEEAEAIDAQVKAYAQAHHIQMHPEPASTMAPNSNCPGCTPVTLSSPKGAKFIVCTGCK